MNKTHKLVTYSLLIALVCVGTMFIKIHVPATNGYVNIGDAFIIISSLMFGPVAGMIAGGIGSAMADLLSGYAHFAVFTLIVKGIEGYIIGWLFVKFGGTKLAGMYSSLAGVAFMVLAILWLKQLCIQAIKLHFRVLHLTESKRWLHLL